MQINSFLLLRTTSDKGVPGQSNPSNVPSCLSPLLSFPVLPAESYGRWGGGCGLAAREMREEMHSNGELGSWGRRGKEGGVCVQVQLCGKRLEPGGRITSSSDSGHQLWVTLGKRWDSHAVKPKVNVGSHANFTV